MFVDQCCIVYPGPETLYYMFAVQCKMFVVQCVIVYLGSKWHEAKLLYEVTLISMQKIGPKENKYNSNISLNGKTS